MIPETPPLLAKDPALMIRADTTAPIFNDVEKHARATTQVHKVARGGYSSDVGTFAFWAGCNSATTLFAGARHVGVIPDFLTVARWTLRERGHGWGNRHHPSGTASALLGNSRTRLRNRVALVASCGGRDDWMTGSSRSEVTKKAAPLAVDPRGVPAWDQGSSLWSRVFEHAGVFLLGVTR